jgi:hypothetical protein
VNLGLPDTGRVLLLQTVGYPAESPEAGGQRKVLDGPFAETKELVGGFWMIDVETREEAIAWAMRCPIVPGKDEVVEIRQLTGASDLPRELVDLIEAAAPTWSAAFTKSRAAR